jgi:HlyD family secretion protein
VVIAEKRLSEARNYLKNASGTTAKAQAQNALTAAERAYHQAVWLVDWYQSEPTELEQALLDGNLAFARARMDNAERELALLMDDSDPDAVGLAEARLKVAETGLIAAQSALADTEIQSPFKGTVTSILVDPGEVIVPGQVLLTVADLEHFQVETTDLSERDVARVKIGQAATVFLEAFGEEIEGQVSSISFQSSTLGGDVVYTATIDLPTHPENLRWGMSVEVQISTD